MGAIERPSAWKLEFAADPNRHLVLQELAAVEKSALFEGLGNRLARSTAQNVLIFVPGYNVDFESAMLRLGQLSYDLQLESPILFSWPSRGSVTAYLVDQENAMYAVPHLVSFVADLLKTPHIGSIDIVAHGLGCRVAVDSVLGLHTADAISLWRRT
jgi:esterase/lipase superfamily enzyme